MRKVLLIHFPMIMMVIRVGTLARYKPSLLFLSEGLNSNVCMIHLVVALSVHTSWTLGRPIRSTWLLYLFDYFIILLGRKILESVLDLCNAHLKSLCTFVGLFPPVYCLLKFVIFGLNHLLHTLFNLTKFLLVLNA